MIKEQHDPVNHPSHYIKGGIESLDIIEAFALGFHEANVLKYILRAKFKENELQDLKKAKFYLDRLIQRKEALM